MMAQETVPGDDDTVTSDEQVSPPVVEEKPKKRRVGAGKRLCPFCEEPSLSRDWIMNGEHCPKCEVRMRKE